MSYRDYLDVHTVEEVAQMLERTLSMREAQGSIPCSSTFFLNSPFKKNTSANKVAQNLSLAP